MAPVIRVSDEVFRRLQAISEPLVDTPSRVLERLLASYESSHEVRKLAGITTGPALAESSVRNSGADDGLLGEREAIPNIFLAPARAENLRESLDRPVRLDFARRFLSEKQFADLAAQLGERQEFHCWAASQGKLSYFEAMRPNDYVVFTETGTGRLRYVARAVTRLVSERLGEALWPVVPGLPWKYIYVLDRVRRIDVPKAQFLCKLGYDPDYPVYGFIRVAPSRVREALSSFATVEGLLAASTD